MFPNAEWLNLFLVIPFGLAFWWVIRRETATRAEMLERQRRYDAARAARAGDHD